MCDSPEGVSILARIERKGKQLREDVQLLKAAAALSASVTFSSRSESCSGRCSMFISVKVFCSQQGSDPQSKADHHNVFISVNGR